METALQGHKMIPRMYLAIIAFVVLQACSLVETRHFLSDPALRLEDPQLYGTWVLESDSEAYLLILEKLENDKYRVAGDLSHKSRSTAGFNIEATLIIIDKESEAEPVLKIVRTKAFVSELAGQKYVNVAPLIFTTYDPEADALDTLSRQSQIEEEGLRGEGFQILAYRITGDTLNLYAMDADFVSDEVKAGRIPGKVEKGGDIDHVKISLETDELAKYVSQTKFESLFDPLLEEGFRRVRAPE